MKGVAQTSACGLICSISEWNTSMMSWCIPLAQSSIFFKDVPCLWIFGGVLPLSFGWICHLRCMRFTQSGVHIWGRYLLCKRIAVSCDNQLLSALSIKGAPHQKDITPFMRSITWSSIAHNVIITGHHMPGYHNILAFFVCVPEMWWVHTSSN